MIIRHIPASELLEFAQKAGSYYEGSIPITPWRAQSQIINPFAKRDDILLIVADEGRKLLGYIGILPGKVGADNSKRLFWNSCWWVEKGAGARVSLTLLNEIMKITKKQLAFSDLSEKTKQIIEKLGFPVSERKGVIFKIKSGLHYRISTKKRVDFKSRILFILSATGLFKWMDFTLNTILPTGMKKLKNIDNPSAQKLWIPDEEIYSFIEKTSQNQITVPDEAYFEWLLKSRWLVPETKERRALSKRYFFSSLAKNFEIFLIKVKTEDQVLGVALLGSREGVVKTHYLWYKNENSEAFFNGLCSQITEDKKNHRIISFHEDFAQYLRKRARNKSVLKEITRYTAISPEIKGNKENYAFQDGDGDYIFT